MGTHVKQTTDRKEMRISSRVETKRNIRAPTRKKKGEIARFQGPQSSFANNKFQVSAPRNVGK